MHNQWSGIETWQSYAINDCRDIPPLRMSISRSRWSNAVISLDETVTSQLIEKSEIFRIFRTILNNFSLKKYIFHYSCIYKKLIFFKYYYFFKNNIKFSMKKLKNRKIKGSFSIFSIFIYVLDIIRYMCINLQKIINIFLNMIFKHV